jgi:hypothetical protein
MIIGMEPSRAVAWVYHANTPRQWRLICWFGVEPDFTRLRQPYGNPTDARVQELIANGSEGAASYDWWLIEQTKNVSAEKTCHPAQTPVEVMRRDSYGHASASVHRPILRQRLTAGRRQGTAPRGAWNRAIVSILPNRAPAAQRYAGLSGRLIDEGQSVGRLPRETALSSRKW